MNCNAVTGDGNGNVWCAGWLMTTRPDMTDAVTLDSFDAHGASRLHTQWAAAYGSGATAVAISTLGSVWLAGSASAPIDFGLGPLNAAPEPDLSSDAFIVNLASE